MERTLEELRELAMKELDEIVERKEMDENALHCAYKLIDIVKDIDQIEMGEEGYSQTGHYSMYPYAWTDGHSYKDGGYARQRRDSMGRYSRDYDRPIRGYSGNDEREEIMGKMEHMMNNASSETERQVIQRIMNQM